MNRAPVDLLQQKRERGLEKFQRLLQEGGPVFFLDPKTGEKRNGVPMGITGGRAIIEVPGGHLRVPFENILQNPP